MKALLMDVGNSRIKWGVLEDGEIRRTGHISQERIRDKGLQAITTKIPRRVDEVFISNVAGTTFATRLSGVVGMHSNAMSDSLARRGAAGVSRTAIRNRGAWEWIAGSQRSAHSRKFSLRASWSTLELR